MPFSELLEVSGDSGFPRGHLGTWSLGIWVEGRVHTLLSVMFLEPVAGVNKTALSSHNAPVGRTLILSALPCFLGCPTSRCPVDPSILPTVCLSVCLSPSLFSSSTSIFLLFSLSPSVSVSVSLLSLSDYLSLSLLESISLSCHLLTVYPSVSACFCSAAVSPPSYLFLLPGGLSDCSGTGNAMCFLPLPLLPSVESLWVPWNVNEALQRVRKGRWLRTHAL